MERERALRLQRRSLEAMFRAVAGCSEGAELIERDGVVAALVRR